MTNKPLKHHIKMRCKNCGWENPDGTTNCEKCHSVLDVVSSSGNQTNPVSDRLKGTVAEGVIFGSEASDAIPQTCPKCGYPISDDSSSCPNCNFEFKPAPTAKQLQRCGSCGVEISADAKFCPECGQPVNGKQARKIQRSGMGTVMGGPVAGGSLQNRFCTLKPIAWPGEDVNYNPVTYSGETVVLNRSNTDANNNSITSREQAVLTYEEGNWYIENRSELRTTYVRVNGRVKLSSGDIIVLGNREFEFKG